jgi:UDP-N-acetylmuramoyl-L-alanyl-D-glutamate--2,6-diaminopimelate ligase
MTTDAKLPLPGQRPVLASLGAPLQAAQWLRQRVRGRLRSDSRQVQPGDGFIAWPGAATDGRRHVASALARGASACLVEQDGIDAWSAQAQAWDSAGVASYAGLKAATGPIAAAFYGQPSQALELLAVTGTNGKTSTTWWIAQALSKMKQAPLTRCALVGTLGIGEPPALVGNGLTTPDPVTLQHHLREFVTQGYPACAIEASSIGIAERRLDGCEIRVAAFTNFTHDHLDYHGSMAAYWEAKAELFRWPGLRAAVVNLDDLQGVDLAADLAKTSPQIDLLTFGVVDSARAGRSLPPRLQACKVHYAAHGDADQAQPEGLCFEVHEARAGEKAPDVCVVRTRLIGLYNVANLLAVIGCLRALGVPLADAAQVCASLDPVPGRMECLGDAGQPLAVVDYAHTPDALDKALAGLRTLARQRGGQLWCVFGCGGDRDPGKRPIMAAVAERGADQVVITSDNPRSERPQTIISQILLGLSHGHDSLVQVHVEPDRALAIARALADAAPQDVVLIAGKGHEAYQEIAGQRQPFSDQAHARAALAWRPAAGPRHDLSGALA